MVHQKGHELYTVETESEYLNVHVVTFVPPIDLRFFTPQACH